MTKTETTKPELGATAGLIVALRSAAPVAAGAVLAG
jgi:hypothetical protein